MTRQELINLPLKTQSIMCLNYLVEMRDLKTFKAEFAEWGADGRSPKLKREQVPLSKSSEKSVIDAGSRFAKKLIAPEYSWRLTPKVEEAIERAIFVKKAHPLRLV